jgi:hypothetical protein
MAPHQIGDPAGAAGPAIKRAAVPAPIMKPKCFAIWVIVSNSGTDSGKDTSNLERLGANPRQIPESTAMNMKAAIITGAALSFAVSIAFAQQPAIAADANGTLSNSQGTGDSQAGRPQKAISQDQVRRELQQAGFNDIEFLESAYVVRATNSNGTKLVMTITPQEVRAVEMSGGRPTGNATGPAGQSSTPAAQNSGPGIAGQPGNKNGPAMSASGAVSGKQQNEAVREQDSAKIPGKPGGKSGPAVMPPSGAPK